LTESWAYFCPVLALGELRDIALPFSVEVLAFADEEGVRFPTALIGPRSLAGSFDPASLELRDAKRHLDPAGHDRLWPRS